MLYRKFNENVAKDCAGNLDTVVCSAMFLKKIGFGTHSVTQDLVREGEVLVISMP
jgi:hypothetical protein